MTLFPSFASLSAADLWGDAVAAGLIQVDAEGRVRALNGMAAHWVLAEGAAPDSPVGQPVNDLLPAGGEVSARGQDGKLRRLAVTARPLADGGHLITLTDITAQGEATSSRQTFLSTVSHEIRTPLNAIVGLSLLALRRENDPRQRDYLDKINRAADTLLRVINDILDYARIESGKLELESAPFLVEDVLSKVADIVTLSSEAKGLDVHFHIAPEVPRLLVGDGLRLEQILINLAGNAAKFTDSGDIVIGVDLDSPLTANQARLRVVVRDSGIGMSAAQLARLFQPFTQEDASTTRRHGGTGLGLAICHTLVHLMQGEIRATSSPGEGSEFTFVIPFGRDALAESRLLPWPESFHGLRLLLVDDNPTGRLLLDRLLSAHGMVVDSVDSGDRALLRLSEAAAQGWSYDGVILDAHLPGNGGLETARLIRKARSQHLPTLLLVRPLARAALAEEAREVGIAGFVSQPVIPGALLQTLALALDRAAEGEALPLGGLLPGSQRPPPGLAGRRVLLAEDNAFNRLVLREMLEAADMVVETAGTGRDALALVRPGRYDAVLMDIQMPEMDGLSATRHLRADPDLHGLTIIAMTAHGQGEDRRRSLEAGMDDHLVKPIDPNLLYATLLRRLPQAPAAPVRGATPVPETGASLPATLPGLHLGVGLRAAGGDTRRYAQLVRRFVADFGDVDQRLNDDDAGRLIHTLKGAAAQIGAQTLAEYARNVEALFRQGDAPGEVISGVVHLIRIELNKLREAVAWLPAESSAPVASPLSPAPLDPGMLDDLAQRLDRHLHIDAATLERLTAACGQPAPAALGALCRALDRFDYPTARDALDRLKTVLTQGKP